MEAQMDSIREQGEIANEISEAIAGDHNILEDVCTSFTWKDINLNSAFRTSLSKSWLSLSKKNSMNDSWEQSEYQYTPLLHP